MKWNELLEFALKSTAVWFLAWLAVPLLKRSSAAIRHLVWLVAFLASMTLMPMILFGPVWHIVPWTAGASTSAPIQATALAVSAPVLPDTGAIPIDPPVESAPASLSEHSQPITVNAGTLIIYIWIAGATFVLIRLGIGLFGANRLVRKAARITDPEWRRALAEASAKLKLRRKVAIFEHTDVAVASTVGILRPSILVSRDARSWNSERIRMVLLHELAHVKRNDCALQALARISMAVQWFQPLAYWGARQMAVDQEQASDDLVLSTGADADRYAEGLVAMARDFRAGITPNWVALSMVGPSHFHERVTAILDESRSRILPSRSQSIFWVLSGVAATLMLGVTGFVIHASSRMPARMGQTRVGTVEPTTPASLAKFETTSPVVPQPKRPAGQAALVSQTPLVQEPLESENASAVSTEELSRPQNQSPHTEQRSADTPKWEAVSVRQCSSATGGNRGGGLPSSSPGRMVQTCQSVEGLIWAAYVAFADGKAMSPVEIQSKSSVDGGPSWSKTERYTVNAKAEGTPDIFMMNGPMLQVLLEDRLKLQVHWESREVSAYALTEAKGGARLDPFVDGSCIEINDSQVASMVLRGNLPTRPQPGERRCRRRSGPNGSALVVENEGVSLDHFASILNLDRPVINKTGIAGLFNFHLSFANPVPSATATDSTDSGVPSIFAALGQLGLKLEPTKGPYARVLAIDHIEKPTQ